MDTRHAVGCAALRGGVPCTCWLDAPATAGQTPLWLAVQRLREAVRRPATGPIPTSIVSVLTADVDRVLDAIGRPHECWPPIEEGGEG